MAKRPTLVKARRWAFTWNNYTEENVNALRNAASNVFDYCIFGFEVCPDTGTRHLQGYAEFSYQLAIVTAKGKLDPVMKKNSTIHVEAALKQREANIAYCKKEDSSDLGAVETYGSKWIEIAHKVKNQGKRTDWDNMYEELADKPNFSEFAANHPEVAFKCHAGIDRIIHGITEANQRAEFEAQFDNVVLLPWQEKLRTELSFPADDRKIIWIWEKVGNVGKSWMTKYLAAKHGAARFENGSSKDIAFAYKGEDIVMFDFSRNMEERLNYSIIESLKNGTVFSGKYASTTKFFKPPHIVCFANWPPNMAAMSADRWSIRNLGEEDTRARANTEEDPNVSEVTGVADARAAKALLASYLPCNTVSMQKTGTEDLPDNISDENIEWSLDIDNMLEML